MGQSLEVDLQTSGVTDLYAFQLDLTFDPSFLTVASVSEGNLFGGLGVGFFPGTLDNTDGSVRLISDSLSGSVPGITADGTLLQFVFDVHRAGTATLDLQNVILLDSGLNEISAETTPAVIPISGTAVTPEPGTFLLLLAPLAALGLFRQGRTPQRPTPNVTLGPSRPPPAVRRHPQTSGLPTTPLLFAGPQRP